MSLLPTFCSGQHELAGLTKDNFSNRAASPPHLHLRVALLVMLLVYLLSVTGANSWGILQLEEKQNKIQVRNKATAPEIISIIKETLMFRMNSGRNTAAAFLWTPFGWQCFQVQMTSKCATGLLCNWLSWFTDKAIWHRCSDDEALKQKESFRQGSWHPSLVIVQVFYGRSCPKQLEINMKYKNRATYLDTITRRCKSFK